MKFINQLRERSGQSPPRTGTSFLMGKPCKTNTNLEFEPSIVHLIGLAMTHTPISARGCSSYLPPGVAQPMANNRNIVKGAYYIIYTAQNRRRLGCSSPRLEREIFGEGRFRVLSDTCRVGTLLPSVEDPPQIRQRALGQLAPLE
jgi:hypothetical protein